MTAIAPSSSSSSSNLFSKDALFRELQLHQQRKSLQSSDLTREVNYNRRRRLKENEIQQYNDQQLLIQYRKHIINQTIQHHQHELFQQDIFQTISHYLMENPILTYDRFLLLKEISPENIKKYFTAKVFLYLSPDAAITSIQSIDLIKYMDQSMKIEQQMLKLLHYSMTNEDILMITTEQLQEYFIVDFIPLIDAAHEMDESFYEFYCCQVIQKFSYYLDLQQTNRISIRKIVHSSIMKEMMQLVRLQQLLQDRLQLVQSTTPAGRSNSTNTAPSSSSPNTLRSPTAQSNVSEDPEVNELMDKVNENWFSVNKSINLYTIFLSLDVDRNGLLTIEEISGFQGFQKDPIQFTKSAWKRIFDELIVFSPFELDYRGFIRLVLLLDDLQAIPENHQLIVDQHFHVMHHYHKPNIRQGESHKSSTMAATSSSSASNPFYHISNGFQALKFFWKILTHSLPSPDSSSSGKFTTSSERLTPMKVKFFYDDLNESLKMFYSMELPPFPVFLFEFYDLMNYSSLTCDIDEMNAQNIGPTFDDLLASNQCKLLLLLLLDVQTYWKYENREFLIANQVNDPNPTNNQPSISSSSSSSGISSPSNTHQNNNDGNKLASSNPTSPLEKTSLYDAHMTNYHYYSDDNYDEDSFYSDEDASLSHSSSSTSSKGQLNSSLVKRAGRGNAKKSEDDDEEVDQLSSADQSMKSKFQQYSSNNNNRNAIENLKKSLNISDLLTQNNGETDDYYDF